MIKNIGKKIKILAQIIGYGGTAFSVLGCVGNLISSFDYYYLDSSVVTTSLVGLIVLPPLCLASMVLIYGFGQLVENSDKLIELITNEEESKK